MTATPFAVSANDQKPVAVKCRISTFGRMNDHSQSDLLNPSMTAREMTSMFGVEPRTAAGWRARGVGPKWMLIEGRYRYRRADVLAYIAEREAEAAAERAAALAAAH